MYACVYYMGICLTTRLIARFGNLFIIHIKCHLCTYSHTRKYLSNPVMLIYVHTLRVCVLIKFKVLSKLKMYLDLKISYIWTDKQSWLNARIC